MLNELELEPWVIAEQLRHTDGGRLVLELYGHPDRNKAIERMRRAYAEPTVTPSRGQRAPVSVPTGDFSGDGLDRTAQFPGKSRESKLFPPSPPSAGRQIPRRAHGQPAR